MLMDTDMIYYVLEGHELQNDVQTMIQVFLANRHYTRTEEECKMLISAISIGDTIGFVTFPGEAYDTIAEAVEERSPYDFNIFLGYAVQHLGYLPNEAAWEYGCYEVDITRWAKGFDRVLEDQYITMLEELYNT